MTGWSTPGAGPRTRNGPRVNGATSLNWPVDGSSTPTPPLPSAMYAMRPSVRPPNTGEGECWTEAAGALLHAAASSATATRDESLDTSRQSYLHQLPERDAGRFCHWCEEVCARGGDRPAAGRMRPLRGDRIESDPDPDPCAGRGYQPGPR